MFCQPKRAPNEVFDKGIHYCSVTSTGPWTSSHLTSDPGRIKQAWRAIHHISPSPQAEAHTVPLQLGANRTRTTGTICTRYRTHSWNTALLHVALKWDSLVHRLRAASPR